MLPEPINRLRHRLREACIHDPLVGTAEFEITADGDLLQLRGEVPNAAAKAQIEALARRLAPEMRIDNGILVSVSRLHDDAQLARQANIVVSGLLPNGSRGGVTVKRGKAILRGEWPSLSMVEKAREIIGRVPGIAAVEASSVILPFRADVPQVGIVPLDQRDTVNLLEERLARGGYRLGDWVDAHMSGGTVEMTGVVDTPEALQTVLEIAARTPGVRRVINHLIVRQDGGDADRQAEARIHAALGKSGDAAEPVDVKVFVMGDRAYLWGRVDTPEAKDQAHAMANQDPAIRYVTDWITVVTRRSRPHHGPGTTFRRRAG